MRHPNTYSEYEYSSDQGVTRLKRKEYESGGLAGPDDPAKEEMIFETKGEIALLFDYNSKCPHESVLLKHGDPEVVSATWQASKPLGEALKRAGESQLVMLKGQFSVNELNKMINIAGYVGTWYSTMITVDERQNLHRMRNKQKSGGLSL